MIEFMLHGGVYSAILDVVVFIAACALCGGKTYIILALASIFNVFVGYHEPTSTVVYSAGLDVITLIAILTIGDKHIDFQKQILITCLFLHVLFEIGQSIEANPILHSYTSFILTMTILQILGAVYGGRNRIMGAIEQLWRSHSNIHIPNYRYSHSHPSRIFEKKEK
jgi:hypothetical protein